MTANYLKLFNENVSYFTALIDKSRDVFWLVNSDYSSQIYVNPAFETIWGYESQALYDNPLFWLDTVVPEDKLRLASHSRLPHSCVLNSYREKYRIIRSNGEIRWILDQTYPIFNSTGQCIGYAGIAQDITQTTHLEQELLIANKFLPKLAEKMEHSAFWVRDSSLEKQLYLSKGYEKVWGRPLEYLFNHPEAFFNSLLPEDRGIRRNENVLTTLASKGEKAKFVDIYRIKRPDGEIRWVRDSSFPIFDDVTHACIGFAGIAQDITKEKLYEIQLQEAKNKAEAANVAKSNFIASMSHDFRTPLNGLLGIAEILKSGRMYPEQKECVEAILQAGNTLLDLVEDIINFVALDLNKLPLNEVWFDLERLIDEIILTLSPHAHEKKIELLKSVSKGLPIKIYGDSNRTRRIIMNLVNNAIKFTDNGHVLVSIEVSKKTSDKIWTQLIVEDTGIGIAPGNFEFIFGSFNRIDPSYRGRYKGAGLGLTIVKQFVEEMGGSIKLNSQANQGCVFYCDIPFKLKTKQKPKAIEDNYTKIKTLYVDDFNKRAKTFIKQFGLQDTQITSSDVVIEKLTHAKDKKEPFQLVIIDDEISDYDPIQLVKWIRKDKIFKKTLVILVLNDKAAWKTLKLQKMGFFDYLMKPIESLAVIQLLENVFVKLSESFDKPINRNFKKKPLSVLLVEDDNLTKKVTKWMLEEFYCNVTIANTGKEALELLKNTYDLIIMDVGLPDIDGITLASTIRQTMPEHALTPIVALTAHVLDKDKEKCIAAGMNDFLKKPLFKKDLKKLLLRVYK